MERQAPESLQATISTEALGDPQTVGPYKVLEKIGEGGFGVVYMAEQIQPIQRRVALKVIKAGMDTKQVIARFEAERQALAIMDHPNIGKILDAGATGSGRPYFVMELVRGIPITDYCAERRLSTQERLELFKEVCRAIEHAHQKGIMHRDIKPSNVLVYNNGERAVPKVINFGIAKATQGRLTDKTLFTQFHQFIGTPAYMSPEQAQMSGVDVDTRSDIYSLGVLLYELLTGKTPLDPRGLNKQAYQEACRRIREDEAPVPSKRVSPLTHDERSALADSQQTTPANISARLRGDLDWIVMKALEKDRSRRYKSTDAFVTDIVRHLNNEPVSAGPPNVGYLFRKFVRRNRAAVLTTTGGATLLLLGTIATTTLWLRANDAANQLSLQVQETEDALGRAEKETARATKAESVARQARERAQEERDRSIEIAYQADMYVAHQALLPQSFNMGLARRILEQTRSFTSTQDPRHWEWRALWLQCQGDAERNMRIGPGWGLVEPIPNTTKFVAAGQNNGVSVWDDSRGKQLQTLIEPEWNIFRTSCSVDGKWIYIGDKYGEILVWSWNGKRFEATETAMEHGTKIVDMAVSGDGKWLVTLGKVTSGRFLAQAKVWDLATGKLRKTLPEGKAGAEGQLAISTDSSKLLIGLAEEVRIFELDTLEEQHSIPLSGWHSLAVSPDKESLAFTAQESGFRVHRPDGEFVGRVDWETDTRASSLAYSPDAKTIAACDGQIVRLYDTATLREIRTLRGHDAFINCVAFSDDGKTLLSSDDDGKVGVWNMDQHPAGWPDSRKRLSLTNHWFRQHSQVSFSFDGSEVASTLGGWNDESRHIAILSSDELVAKQKGLPIRGLQTRCKILTGCRTARRWRLGG